MHGDEQPNNRVILKQACSSPVWKGSLLQKVFFKLLFLARNQACECCVSINASFFETLENIRLKDNIGSWYDRVF